MKPRNTKSEGRVDVLGFSIFYKVFAPPMPRATILCLHGGPGATHDYLLPIRDLAKFGYRVVFYDQLGCGNSEMPKNYALFTVERAVEELEVFRRVMKLGKVHLMGSSYGGMLALAYALKYQRNLRSLITTGGLASIPLTISEMERLKSELPPDVIEVLEKYEARGEYENPKYEEAVMVFYKKHLLRRKNWPAEQIHTMTHMSKPVYGTMNGPNEFTIIGNLRYWDITDRLHEIRVPTLVTGGRHDEVSPKVAKSIHDHIKGSKLVTFEKSSHLPMWEERSRYMSTLDRFMRSVDSA